MRSSRKQRALIVGAILALISGLACSDNPARTDAKISADANTDMARRSDGAASDEGVADQRLTEDGQPVDAKIGAESRLFADLPAGCNTGKIAFTQKNPAKYEIWELCFPAGDTATEAAIKRIDPTAKCNHRPGGIAARCPTGSWRCMGALERDPFSKEVKPAAWARLCRLSSLPAVSRIAGGHFI